MLKFDAHIKGVRLDCRTFVARPPDMLKALLGCKTPTKHVGPFLKRGARGGGVRTKKNLQVPELGPKISKLSRGQICISHEISQEGGGGGHLAQTFSKSQTKQLVLCCSYFSVPLD